ncbi:MAG: sugar ABC transporter permease [Candidatus Methanomethylicia archaeon]
MILALILYYHSSRLRNFLIVILSIPPMISPLVVSYMGRLIFHPGASPINYILEIFGLPHNISWHASVQTSLITIFLVDTWQWTPFIMLLLFSGLIAIPEEYLESARIDGATSLKEVRYIVLPLLKSTMIVAILFRSLDILRMFDVVYILTNGGPGTSSEVSSFYIYLTSFPYWRIGYGAALSWIFMIIASIVITIYLRYVIKTF